MNIGIFDSGLGGLYTMKYIVKALPQYDYIYLGDTKRVPYGHRTPETIYRFLKEGINELFARDCALVIVACNTASAGALRKLQQEYLPKHFPDRRVLGIIIPLVETANFDRIGILGTVATIASGSYTREILQRNPKAKVFEAPAPLLVPMIEAGTYESISETIRDYVKPLLKKNIAVLVLACTHYPIIKSKIRAHVPKHVQIIAQDTIIGKKLKEYLKRHPEIEKTIGKKKGRKFLVTQKTAESIRLGRKWFGENIQLKQIALKRRARK